MALRPEDKRRYDAKLVSEQFEKEVKAALVAAMKPAEPVTTSKVRYHP